MMRIEESESEHDLQTEESPWSRASSVTFPNLNANGIEDQIYYKFYDAFFCPITKELLKDPVVTSNGKTYERSAAEECFPLETLYPNRALRAVLQQTMGSSSTQLGIDDFMEKHHTLACESPGRDLPDEYYCPITHNLMTDPVIDPDGYTYDREAIVDWIHKEPTSPLSRNPLSVEMLYDNRVLFELLEEEKQLSERYIHPSVRRWKTETEAEATKTFKKDIDDLESSLDGSRATTSNEISRQRQRRTQAEGKCLDRMMVLCVILGGASFGMIVYLYITSNENIELF